MRVLSNGIPVIPTLFKMALTNKITKALEFILMNYTRPPVSKTTFYVKSSYVSTYMNTCVAINHYFAD